MITTSVNMENVRRSRNERVWRKKQGKEKWKRGKASQENGGLRLQTTESSDQLKDMCNDCSVKT